MTNEEIITGNKHIAEFMGGKYSKDLSFPIKPHEIWLPVHGVCRHDTIALGAGKSLQYDHSWEWIMPVIEKVASSYHTVSINYDEGMCQCIIIVYDKNGAYKGEVSVESSSAIEAIWEAVVKFINKYNQNK